ncbi:MAG: prepilin peptidase [Acidimicrobiales bacterium]
MLVLLVVGSGVLGLAVGSFLNVVIYRVPRGESVVRPRSHCRACGALIRERDNIPVVSWFVLKGRCRDCGATITSRYVIVELLTGGLFAGVAARLGIAWDLPAYLGLFAVLVVLAFVDGEYLKLPKRIVYPGLMGFTVLLVVAAGATNTWHNLVVAASYGVVWFVVFFIMNLVSPRILGFGDVRLAPLLGLSLGWFGAWYVVLGFFLSNLIGAVISIVLLSMKRIDRRQPVPYGVFLALGTAITIFVGPQIIGWLPATLR